jgi:hypothetical protein
MSGSQSPFPPSPALTAASPHRPAANHPGCRRQTPATDRTGRGFYRGPLKSSDPKNFKQGPHWRYIPPYSRVLSQKNPCLVARWDRGDDEDRFQGEDKYDVHNGHFANFLDSSSPTYWEQFTARATYCSALTVPIYIPPLATGSLSSTLSSECRPKHLTTWLNSMGFRLRYLRTIVTNHIHSPFHTERMSRG